MAGRTRTARPVPHFRGAVVGPLRETSSPPHPNLSALVSLPSTSSMRWSCVPLTVFPCFISLLFLLLFSLGLRVSRVDICSDGFALGHSRVEARFWGGIFGEGTTTREILLRSFGSCRYGQATCDPLRVSNDNTSPMQPHVELMRRRVSFHWFLV